MKAKVLIFVLMTLAVLLRSSKAVKIKVVDEEAPNMVDITQNEDNEDTEDKASAQNSVDSANELEKAVTAQESTPNNKEVHKRGIYYNGAGLGAASLAAHSFWPKSYASHYGYGGHAHLGLPTSYAAVASAPAFATAHAPSFLRHAAGGIHYKSAFGLAAGAAAPHAVTTLADLPHASHSLPHAHAYAHSAPATPYVLRPGGAVVQSYNVNYPQYYKKPALAVQHVQPVAPAVQHVTPVQHLTPLQQLPPVQHFAPVQHVAPVHPVQHIQPVQHFQPIHHVQPVHHVQPIEPVQHVQPIAPVQHVHPVVQVQPSQPIQPVQHIQPLHHYFQTTFLQPAPPPAPAVPVAPVIPAVPSVPTIPAIPAIPTIPTVPALPAFPALPNFPSFPFIPQIPVRPAPPAPTVPAIPTIPTVPSVPSLPAIPVAPVNPVFTVGVQPIRPQLRPTFINFPFPPNNEALFPPGVFPIAGPNRPDSGSAEAAPQIPPTARPKPRPKPRPTPTPEPEPELPAEQPTQEPWKPMFYRPPTTIATPAVLTRPSNTLLPPYGSSLAEGYLPPAHQFQQQENHYDQQQELSYHHHHHQQQQQHLEPRQRFRQTDNIFDNLSDAEIEQIFAQANLAVQQEERQQQQQQQQQQQHNRNHHNLHSQQQGYSY